MIPHFRQKLHKIKALVFDVDGVFSQFFVVDRNAEYLRIMNAKDGFAIRYAKEQEYIIGIITGGNSEAVKERFLALGITDVYLGQRYKMTAYLEFCQKYNLTDDEILYMGDDLPDFEILKRVGVSSCPADAAREILEICDYISDKKAGEGCVRDIVEQVMRVQNKWNYLTDKNINV